MAGPFPVPDQTSGAPSFSPAVGERVGGGRRILTFGTIPIRLRPPQAPTAACGNADLICSGGNQPIEFRPITSLPGKVLSSTANNFDRQRVLRGEVRRDL